MLIGFKCQSVELKKFVGRLKNMKIYCFTVKTANRLLTKVKTKKMKIKGTHKIKNEKNTKRQNMKIIYCACVYNPSL